MKSVFSLDSNIIPEMEFERDIMRATGITLDLTRFALSFGGAVLSGIAVRGIRNPTARNLFSTVVGFLLLYYPFGSHVLHGVITSLATYLVMWLIPRKCGTLAWLICFPYLTVLHVVNASGVNWNAGNLDFTGGQMVLTLKLISMAVCFQDANSKKDEELSSYQRAHVFRSLPSLLEYLGFVFAFGNLLAGPVIEFRDYQMWANREGPWDPRAKRVPWTGDFAAGVRAFVTAVLSVSFYLYMERTWNFRLLATPWYAAQPLLVKLVTMQARRRGAGGGTAARVVAAAAPALPLRPRAARRGVRPAHAAAVAQVIGTTYRTRYYFAWSLGHCSLAFAGLDFLKWDSQTQAGVWGRCRNAQPLKVEFCDSSRLLAGYWNTTTGTFLRRYVYERLTVPGKKPTFVTLMVTQLVSGVWHGLYPGYIMFFAGSAIFFAHSTVLFNWERAYVPPLLARSPLWWAAKVFLTKQGLDFLAMAFLWLTWRECVAAWASVHYLPLIYMSSVLVLGNVFPARAPRRAGGAAGAAGGDANGGGGGGDPVSGDHLHLGEGIKSALVDGAASRPDLANGVKQD
ncbi:LPLAT1 [Scenedesmus sp. PABB004]|nr:LPLAT1 [Scenedesmus sp. PABB004]